MSRHILVGVAWPYANGPLHLGHVAGCYLPADIFARYNRMVGNQVLMVSGSDQHGTPITVRAEQEKISPAEVAARYHASFMESWQKLGIQWELFTRTTTENHYEITQRFFLRLHEQGYIYPQTQRMLYCPKDARFLPDRYVEGTCPHCGSTRARGDQCDDCGRTIDALELKDPRCKFCGTRPEVRETEHFFCKWSAFNERLKEYIADKDYWKPNVLGFTRRYLEDGLIDSAITRDLDWGVPVPLPGYEGKRIYVWFDAVIGYFSASIEWAKLQGTPDRWKEWWEDPEARTYYFVGKDNIPFHAVRWPAALLGYGGLNLPYDVPANEYLTLEHEAFSTSRNWAVWVPDFLERYDPDPLRYFLCANMPESADSDFSWAEFVRRNNTELVAAYGNLVQRTLTQVQRHFEGKVPAGTLDAVDRELLNVARESFGNIGRLIEACSFREAIKHVMAACMKANAYIDKQEPWKKVKEDKARAGVVLQTMLQFINNLRVLFTPFLPNSANQLYELLGKPDGDEPNDRWEYREMPIGHALSATGGHLFKKLDEAIIEQEVARLRGETPLGV
jgi:methionyl-tRNA synthetase